jgi:hypothetical protein
MLVGGLSGTSVAAGGTMNNNGWGRPADQSGDKSTWGGFVGAHPKRNFWGDIDGDGRETAWDDVLGDGLLGDAMAAQERERRGEPPLPEDEWLIGRRHVPPARKVAGSTASDTREIGLALLVVGLALGLCALMTALFR